MFKLRTWMLALALAVGLVSAAQASPPATVMYGPGTYSGGMRTGTVYAPNGTYAVNGAPAVNGARLGAPCANGAGHGAHISTGDHGRCKECCPPAYRHCIQGPPHLHFRRGCPAPVCSPCDAPNWGYFQPCWNPWPWPPDWSHCPVIPPAAYVIPGPVVEETGVADGVLPTPRKGGL